MKRVLLVLKVAIWLGVAYLPLALDKEVTDFMVNSCTVGSECLNYTMPLIVQIEIVSLAARILLWPLAAWNLVGCWLLRYFRTRQSKHSGEEVTNA